MLVMSYNTRCDAAVLAHKAPMVKSLRDILHFLHHEHAIQHVNPNLRYQWPRAKLGSILSMP